MSSLFFFVRRLLTGAVARGATNKLSRKYNLSPAMMSIVFIVLTEVLARVTEGRQGKRA